MALMQEREQPNSSGTDGESGFPPVKKDPTLNGDSDNGSKGDRAEWLRGLGKNGRTAKQPDLGSDDDLE